MSWHFKPSHQLHPPGMVDFKTRAPSAQQVHRPEEATEKDKEKTGTRAVPETTTAANEEIIKNAITVAWKTT